MFKTEITDLFQIKHPIIQGGLQGLGREMLVSAVSNAGALGLLTAGSYEEAESFRQAIHTTKNRTDQPFGVNITIGIRRPMDEFIDVVIEEEVPIVFTSGYNPEKYMDRLKEAGAIVTHVVPSIRFAKKAEEIGCDAVVVVGYETAGHPGNDFVSTLVLIQKAVKELNIPVIAAGGFATGKSLLAALSLGAAGVQMGTRFMLTKESPLHEMIKKHMIQKEETDTLFVKKSIHKPMRVMKTKRSEYVAKMEEEGCTLEQLLKYVDGTSYQQLIKKGDIDAGVISLGQVVGVIDEIEHVEQVIERIISEANEQLNHLKGLIV